MPAKQPENDVVTLHGETIDLASNAGRELVADCTRAAENLISDDDLRAKWELSPSDLENLTQSKALVKAIRSERERRVRSGLAAREAAAGYLVQAPKVLNSIMSDTGASPRHRIESARELRATATAASDARTENVGPNFLIRIDLTRSGGGIEEYPPPKELPAPGPIEPGTHKDKVDEDIGW
jgi:hypothetical protein